MSTLTPATPVLPPESAVLTAQSTERFRRRVAGVCLIAAPVAFAAAEILVPESDGTAAQVLAAYAAHRTAGLLAPLLGILSVVLFVPGIVGVVKPIVGPGRRWANAAAAAIICGLVTAHAALGGLDIAFSAMSDPSLDRTQMVRLLDVVMHTPAAGVPLLLGHEIFGLGIIALGIAVIRSRAYPRWTGIALILWLVVDATMGSLPAPRIAGDVVSSACGVAALATIGWGMLTRSFANSLRPQE